MTEKQIGLKDLKEMIAVGDEKTLFLDVRSAEECYAAFVPGFVNIPTAELGKHEQALVRFERYVVLCASGMRARQAASNLEQLFPGKEVMVLKGGLNSVAQGAEKELSRAGRILPVQQQMQIGAGSMIILATLLGTLVNPAAYLLAGGIGFGLLYAGCTGRCSVSRMLAHMPWNKNLPSKASSFVRQHMALS